MEERLLSRAGDFEPPGSPEIIVCWRGTTLISSGRTLFSKTTRDTTVLGHRIAEGAMLGLDVYAAQRDDAYYQNATELMADRFMRLREEGIKVPQIVPFGVPGSEHVCLGSLLARVGILCTVATLLREFEFEVDPKQSRKMRYIPDTRPKSGVQISKMKKKSF
eukprot:gb/GEZJ01005697.1/.p1 GENE.gb/GEZJ01005697.1/~~gb/GEZJ01005697.1/.p1  ORF type:complete len:163 (-),score=12.04 gb/GEZJ01005697.1/:244-732(-)